MSAAEGVALLKTKVALLPYRAGVYRMLDGQGRVLYVGKAKSLRKRVANYTQYDRLPVRLQRMVAQVSDLIVVETASEAEAFLLENELIKKYKPPFNILLKDDKSFPYLVLTNSEYPRMLKHRGQVNKKDDFFGPYASVSALNETFSVLQKAFGLRTCSDNMFKLRKRPCLLYQIKKCSAPCVGYVNQEEYAKQVNQARDFLKGKNSQIQKQLTLKMKEKSDVQAYEEALILRNRIQALNEIQSYVGGDGDSMFNADFIAMYRKNGEAVFQVFFVRSGQNGGTRAIFSKDDADLSDSEMMESFLGQFYQDVYWPSEIIVNYLPENSREIEKAFALRGGTNIQIKSSVRGVRRRLLDRAIQNAEDSLTRHQRENTQQADLLDGLARLMKLDKIETVEVFDNSHIQGASSVGALICADKTGFLKNRYRRFNIETAQTNDDFGMMKEVLRRRLLRGKTENNLPSVFLIDGGIGQLSSVVQIMEELNIFVPVLAVAKGPDRNAGREKLYLPNDNNPIILDKDDEILHFIQRLRDEAHRFAIGSHRIKRSKDSMHSALDDIEGIGEKRRKKLMAHFGSVRSISAASVADLMRVDGICEKNAKKIYTFFHNDI